MTKKIAVVTGASSGIGKATAVALAADGWHVVAAARRVDRLEELVEAISATGGSAEAIELDVTREDSVVGFASRVPHCDLLVNNAGGAKGLDSVADADLDDWQWMYDTNVLGTLRVTKALLDKLIASGDGQVINIASIAAHVPYVGGAGYNAAKHGVAAMTRVLRLEQVGQPLRICEIDPGRVKTEEFSLVRFGGDAERADKVYEGHLNLTAEDIAEVSAPDPAPGPQQQAERRETQEAVRNAILQLTPEYRQIVVLRFLEDLSYEEIGAALKLPSGTVKSRLNRAKAQLKDILSKSGNLFGSPSVIHTETQGKEARP